MIYLITGVPGSGKTLYAVSTLVQSLVKQRPKRKGVEIVRRLCVDNVRDLLIPHDMLCPLVQNDRDELVKSDADGQGVWNWPDWCQPGDVIVIDEVQRHWRPRGMGVKPAREIQALETHRHLGVDFVIVTQNPMLIDQNVRRLVGRHLHIRRLFGMQRAMVYDWDGCSVDVHKTKSASVSFFNYPRSAYALYKSSELHTKQKFKMPMWVLVPVLAIIGGILVLPKAYAVLSSSATGKGVSDRNVIVPPVVAPVASHPVVVPVANEPLPAAASPSYVVPGTVAPEQVKYSGCIVSRGRCGCFDTLGVKVLVEHAQCMAAVPPSDISNSLVPDAVELRSNSSDGAVLADMLGTSRNPPVHYPGPDSRRFFLTNNGTP